MQKTKSDALKFFSEIKGEYHPSTRALGRSLTRGLQFLKNAGKFENHGGAVTNTAILKESAEELFRSEKDTISNYLEQMRSEK
ncbi:MAG: hypothetical protein SH817_03810 [Leptospira sp.]|nr:hypothetical protein [Leptospira sp.]